MAVIARPETASQAVREAARSGQLELCRDHRFDGVKVFSAADARMVGELAAAWIERHPQLELVDITVTSSPGCTSIVITYVRR